jgi:hypothetical protein
MHRSVAGLQDRRFPRAMTRRAIPSGRNPRWTVSGEGAAGASGTLGQAFLSRRQLVYL